MLPCIVIPMVCMIIPVGLLQWSIPLFGAMPKVILQLMMEETQLLPILIFIIRAIRALEI